MGSLTRAGDDTPSTMRILLTRSWQGVQIADEEQWLQRTATEIDNLRAAVLWSLDSAVAEDGDLALRIIADVTAGSFEDWTGVWSWAERAVERAEHASPFLRSTVLAVASSSAFYQADYVTAQRLARNALRDGVGADSPAPELPYMALMVSSRPHRMREILAQGPGRRRREALLTRQAALHGSRMRRPDR